MSARQRKTISATFLVSAGAFAGFFLNSLTSLYIVRVLSKLEYGRMTYFANLLSLILLIFGFGLSAMAIKLIVNRADNPAFQRDLMALHGLRLASLLPLLALALIAGLVGGEAYAMISLAAGSAILNDFLLGLIRGHQRYLMAAAVPLLQAVGYFALLLAGLAQSVEAIFLAYTLSFWLSIVLQLAWLGWRRLMKPTYFPLPELLPPGRRLMSGSGQIYMLGLLQVGYMSGVLALLGGLGRYELVAEFSVPFTLVSLLMLVNSPVITTLVYPRIIRGGEQAAQTFATAAGMVVCVGLALAAVLYAYAEPVIELFYSNRYRELAPLLRLQAPLAALFALESLFTLVQNGLDHFSQALRAQALRTTLLAAGALGLTLNADGYDLKTALSLLYGASTLICLIWQYRDIRRKIRISGHWARLSLCLALAVAAGLGIRWLDSAQVALPLAALKGVALGCATLATLAAIAFGFRFHPAAARVQWVHHD